MKTAVVDALEDCLERMQAGASLEQVLALYPQWAKEMRPLLESALLAWSLRVTTPVPEASMARSRALFIEKAAAQPQPKGLFAHRLRFSHSLIAALCAAVILAIGTSFVSAQSLPGDILYPVKLAGEQTRLLFTTNTTQRLSLQERYDQTRADEVENVLQDHRQVEVTFVGLLTQSIDGHWQVGGVNVVFPSNLEPISRQMLNAYVEVTGLSQNDGLVQVSQVHLRELTFSGTVTDMTSQMWYVDHIGVGIESTTKVTGIVKPGAYVWVNAYRQEDGTLFARHIVVITPAKQEVQQPSQPGDAQTESTGSGNNATATNDEGSSGSGDATQTTNTATSQPTTTSTATAADLETTLPLPTDTPSATRKATSTKARTNTRTSTPTSTPTPTATQTREGGSKPPENGGKTSTVSPPPASTPTPKQYGSDQGG
jgi:hypothetical protein